MLAFAAFELARDPRPDERARDSLAGQLLGVINLGDGPHSVTGVGQRCLGGHQDEVRPLERHQGEGRGAAGEVDDNHVLFGFRLTKRWQDVLLADIRNDSQAGNVRLATERGCVLVEIAIEQRDLVALG